ncbi:MAG TPA: malto-oligosyltrehalose trehalohydrolase [Gammaproteobacteria bacterium]|nr:malto-oligosyltrehalose trehalohydrolase [Gammaproteobacteria bacterium]
MNAVFAHRMPFGAQTGADDRIRFRIWAPGQSQMTLLLPDRSRELLMQRTETGWFELETRKARAGSRYWFMLDDGTRVPDPAARAQADDVHGPSLVVDPAGYRWRHTGWRGLDWNACALYEVHVGAFTAEGNFDGVRDKLDHLADLGVTAIELMPVADFPGLRNWGYDGVLPFAPDHRYGSPDALKRLVDEAHGRGLAVVLDVVYNHFGPDGNYLHLYAPQFFDPDIATPWGAGIDFTRTEVREFFIHNALYWLAEYRFDGLRLDAVHAIRDPSTPDFLSELATRARAACEPGRHIWLVLENDDNAARYLERDAERPGFYTAQWNDDLHHAAHVLATGETHGYYADYADRPLHALGRALCEGFVYQGEPSAHRDGAARGEPSAHLPAAAFVHFLQNHDQVGNRAFGERLAALCDEQPLRALLAVLLLSPQPPLLFMGEEWAASQPFLYFCDHGDALAAAVRDGRRTEFAAFPEFADPAARETIPDPNAAATFEASRLDWQDAGSDRGRATLAWMRALLRLRRQAVVPARLTATATSRQFRLRGDTGLVASWSRGPVHLTLAANLGGQPADVADPGRGDPPLFEWPAGAGSADPMPAWSVAWFLAGRPVETGPTRHARTT